MTSLSDQITTEIDDKKEPITTTEKVKKRRTKMLRGLLSAFK